MLNMFYMPIKGTEYTVLRMLPVDYTAFIDSYGSLAIYAGYHNDLSAVDTPVFKTDALTYKTALRFTYDYFTQVDQAK